MEMRRPRSLRTPRSAAAQVGAAELQCVAPRRGRAGDKTQDGPPGRGFAGADFADDAQALAAQREATLRTASDIAVAPE